MCFFVGCWQATQSLAAKVHYDALLGAPMMVDKGIPYYYPWKWFVWRSQMYQYIPKLFDNTMMWFFGCAVFYLIILFLVHKRKPSTNYGSARWAKYEDLLGMDLISPHGVVVGLYDPPWLQKLTKLVRKLDTFQKEKKAYAEMAFEESKMKQVDKIQTQIEQQEAVGMNPVELRNKKEEILKSKYNPSATWLDWMKVGWAVGLFKKVNKIYSNCNHFYLRDDSNKHMAVIAPTRSGKGVGLIIPTLLGGWTSSCIVNDIKSENWEVTAGYRKFRMGHVTIKFEPTKADGSTARWNPLDEIAIGTPAEESMATNIAHVLADYEGKGKLDHWGSNAEVVILTVMLHLSYAYYSDRKNYVEFRKGKCDSC